jgi:hypothetical protein
LACGEVSLRDIELSAAVQGRQIAGAQGDLQLSIRKMGALFETGIKTMRRHIGRGMQTDWIILEFWPEEMEGKTFGDVLPDWADHSPWSLPIKGCIENNVKYKCPIRRWFSFNHEKWNEYRGSGLWLDRRTAELVTPEEWTRRDEELKNQIGQDHIDSEYYHQLSLDLYEAWPFRSIRERDLHEASFAELREKSPWHRSIFSANGDMGIRQSPELGECPAA